MDTNKIDWVMRNFVMAPIFGFLAFSVLFPVFVTIDAGYASADIGVFNIGIKKIHVEMDWILATSVGIVGAALVIHQISQASLRDAARTEAVLDEDFRNLVVAAADNIRFSEVREGYLYFSDEILTVILCWRHDKVNSEISQFNMMFRIVNDTDTEESILENLRNTEDPNRWTSRILIPLFNERYGTVSESSVGGEIISEIDIHRYDCITHAINYIQILDGNEMKQCKIDFNKNNLRSANDEYLKTNIVTRRPKVGGIS